MCWAVNPIKETLPVEDVLVYPRGQVGRDEALDGFPEHPQGSLEYEQRHEEFVEELDVFGQLALKDTDVSSRHQREYCDEENDRGEGGGAAGVVLVVLPLVGVGEQGDLGAEQDCSQDNG